MKEVIKQELLYNLTKAIEILDVKDEKEVEELKELSDHAIEDVALHKDLDLISVTVLIYSIYKIIRDMDEEKYKDLLVELKNAKKQLEQNNFGRYNTTIKSLYQIISKSHEDVKEHLQDVMHAARIKKGNSLLHKGLSIGQAAGLMGLSNWDLQQYAGRTTALFHHEEATPAKSRLLNAFKLFGVK